MKKLVKNISLAVVLSFTATAAIAQGERALDLDALLE